MTESPTRDRVLFLCTHNSARSQIAEGWARKLLPTGVRIWSAGSEPAAEVHPYAVRVMREVGVDISSQRPKPLSHVPLGDIDTVITLCEGPCALPPDENLRRTEAWELPDPGDAAGNEQEVLTVFRSTRDEIRRRIHRLVG